MFTGIIEETGIVTNLISENGNKTFWITSPLAPELKPDQSVSHNGVCLTVEELKNGMHRVTAIAETLSKTNLNEWTSGTSINLERCLTLTGRLDGHIVQGHVDTVAECIDIIDRAGSWDYRFSFPDEFNSLAIEKGSIALNGISLTLFNVSDNSFTVAIIPYTYKHTNMNRIRLGDSVNVEFDLIGKYVNRIISLRGI